MSCLSPAPIGVASWRSFSELPRLYRHDEIRAVDEELARLGRGAARLRLRIGACLLLLGERGGHHELGFPTLGDYARERCERGPRWAREARALARRLYGQRSDRRGLPRIRAAMMRGELSWSMAEVLARYATIEDEEELLHEAADKTVRQMKLFLKERRRAREAKASKGDGQAPQPPPAAPAMDDDDEEDELPTRLRVRVRVEEVMMLESSRILVELLDGVRASDDHLLSVLMAEGESAMAEASAGRLPATPLGGFDRESLQAFREKLEASRRKKRARQEEQAEKNIPRALDPGELDAFEADEPLPTELLALDAEIRRCCAILAERDLIMGNLARAFFAARGWQVLKYASERQYARERVGVSHSSLVHRITLSNRVKLLPEIGEALRAGQIGYEAAMLVGRIATLDTVEAWLARAQVRTLVHLREEVEAVERRARLRDDASLEPPSQADLDEVAEFERAVQRGDLEGAAAAAGERTQISVTAGAERGAAFSVSKEVREQFEALEREYEAMFPADAPLSFVGFLCVSLWKSWLPHLRANHHKWKDLYIRDRHRCCSPVCDRRGVTPHHLEPQSQGGGDESENMASLCFWCHLMGVHMGRLSATPPFSTIRWEIGRTPIMTVEGRTRQLLQP